MARREELDGRHGDSADFGAAAIDTERAAKADVAQLAERVLGKDEVTSSILVIGSTLRSPNREATECPPSLLRKASGGGPDGS